jgi:hypothetical protein
MEKKLMVQAMFNIFQHTLKQIQIVTKLNILVYFMLWIMTKF